MLPPAIDEYVGRDAPVRVVDAFVDTLDFRTLGFDRATPASTGRPGYDPRDLLKLYIYGYLNEVRSSRRLERECKRNVEVMWLVRCRAPDHKTIADFRRDNGAAIVGVCRAFVLFCRDAGLFAARLVSIDGAKFRAAASQNRVLDKRRIAEEIEKIDTRVVQYLAALDEGDAADPGDGDGLVADALGQLKERRVELHSLADHLEQDDRSLVVDGELDARPMGFGRGGKPPSYNVQIAVDADTGIVVHHAVTDEVNDLRMLHPISKAVKDRAMGNPGSASFVALDSVRSMPQVRPVGGRTAARLVAAALQVRWIYAWNAWAMPVKLVAIRWRRVGHQCLRYQSVPRALQTASSMG